MGTAGGEVLVVMGAAGEDVGKGVAATGAGETGCGTTLPDEEAGAGATAGEDGHCRDVLPAHDLAHC